MDAAAWARARECGEWERATRVGHALVVVAGDVGRSPRMQYHALSLARSVGCAVTLVGYGGSSCCEAVEAEARIRLVTVAEYADAPRWLPSLVARAVKLLVLLYRLGAALVAARRGPNLRAALVLVQTPPALPSLFLGWLAARRDGGRFVADWYGPRAETN